MKIRRCIFVFLVFLGTYQYANAQLKETRFEAVEDLISKEQRPILVFIHTSWCTYCKAMETSVFKDEKIVELLNDHFYFIRLNAEEKHDIRFLNRVFSYKPTGPKTGIHELALALGSVDGKISYPALCVLNAGYEIIFQHNAYLNTGEMLKVLRAVLK